MREGHNEIGSEGKKKKGRKGKIRVKMGKRKRRKKNRETEWLSQEKRLDYNCIIYN